MFDLDSIRSFVAEVGMHLSGGLEHAEVVSLARKWIPEVRFHPDERFHSMSLSQYLAAVRGTNFAPEARFELEDDDGNPVATAPPVLLFAADAAHGKRAATVADLNDARVASGSAFRSIPDDDQELALEHFGSERSQTTGIELPRHPVGAVVELRFLLESFVMWLLAHSRAQEETPRFPAAEGKLLDAVLGVWDFDTAELGPLLAPEGDDEEKSLERRLRNHELDDPDFLAAMERAIETTGIMDLETWRAIQEHVFLEVYLLYAFNNKQDHSRDVGWLTAMWDHDGDVESCALIFDRKELLGDIHSAMPRYIAGTVHASAQGLDWIKQLDPDDLVRATAPQTVERVPVYVAAGSHATLLSAGRFDTRAIWQHVESPAGAVTAALGGPYTAIVLQIIACLEAWFADRTSDDGVHASLDPPPQTEPEHIAPLSIEVTPLTENHHLYMGATSGSALEERIFPGLWGGRARFSDKPARILKKLVWHRRDVAS